MLKGKTVVVTGAAGALGSAVCSKAEGYGATVKRLDLAFQETAEHCYAVDLTDAASVSAVLEEISAFDAVFNVAGGFSMGPQVHDGADDEWDHLFAMNVTTLRNMVAVTVPKLLAAGRGKIVNVGALSAREGIGAMGAYCASKSAVMRLTESMSGELRAQGINVNAVLPSIIDTPTNRGDMPDADFSKWVAPQDLANVICFLGSPSADAIHGALIPVRGLS
ncbi:MAG: SDR family NAD(P)-dependent oxidoreductase [Pseudomonadota bacterium]